jgi:hypothetical protein
MDFMKTQKVSTEVILTLDEMMLVQEFIKWMKLQPEQAKVLIHKMKGGIK